MTTGRFVTLAVREVRHDTPESVVITFEPPRATGPADPDPWRFDAGQHLVLRRRVGGSELRRSYSLCTPAPSGGLTVAIRLVAGGAVSTWANTEVRPGDLVEVMPPHGSLGHGLDPGMPRHVQLFAAGSGITPLLSIAATVLQGHPASTVEQLFVNRTSASTMLLEELEGLRNRHLDRFAVWHVFTREPNATHVLNGRPDSAGVRGLVDRGVLRAEADMSFVCGPDGFLDEVHHALLALGRTPSSVRIERFHAGDGRAPRAAAGVSAGAAPIGTIAASLDHTTTTAPYYDGDAVLDAIERQRPDVPYSCRAGVCSTCKAKLISGQVTMAVHHGLEPDEIADGYVLTCQAVAVTGDLVVDYDA